MQIDRLEGYVDTEVEDTGLRIPPAVRHRLLGVHSFGEVAPVEEVVTAEVETAFAHVDFRDKFLWKGVTDFDVAEAEIVAVHDPDVVLICACVAV